MFGGRHNNGRVASLRKGTSRKVRFNLEFLVTVFLAVVGTAVVLNVCLMLGRPSGGGGAGVGAPMRKSERTVPQKAAGSGSSNKHDAYNYHVVFSTSCSYSHDWQSYLFFYHAMLHEQPGDVTRIVSGCSPEQEQEMRAQHESQFSIMNPNFLIHFTPEFGKQLEGVSFQQTKYWNKPFGLKHWLENRFGYKYEGDISTPYDDDIVVLVDPDMLMQRPFLNDFAGFPDTLWSDYYMQRPELLLRKVAHGHPVAQDYSFGDSWLRAAKKNLTYVVGPDSPVHQVTNDEASVLYAAGPPYWMTTRDAYRIAYHWSGFLPRLFQLFPFFMAEMYGYCMAAAHLGLKHQMARGFMVSNIFMHGEGWTFLDNADDTVCDVAQFEGSVPHVIHFCQRYSIGEYFLNKYLFPSDILSCDFPLMELPPLNIVSYTNYSHYGDGTTEIWEGRKFRHKYGHAFMICSLYPALNKAATFYKQHHCPNGANYETTYNHFRAEEEGKYGKRKEKYDPA